jgi:hypothetical protein
MKPKILGVLQNIYSHYGAGRIKLKDIYLLEGKTCNLSNATYSRIKPVFHQSEIYDAWLTECSREYASNHKQKFDTDHNHIQNVLKIKEWDFIICFGKQSEFALQPYQKDFKILNVPHPVSFKWRKTILDDIHNFIKK